MAKYSDADIEKARNAITLSALIGKHVKLKKAGNEFAGCCPFHNEKSPSFTVSDNKGFYHCFGCGAHGDAIKWLTDYENYTFPDAMNYLLGGDARPGQTRIAQRQSVKRDDEPEFVKSIIVAHHAMSLAQPIQGTIVETYLRSRSIEPDRLRGYLGNIGFVPNCPLYAWRLDQQASDAKTAPAMVAPIHRVERQNSMLFGDRLVTEFIGMHVTYLESDGTDKISGHWPSGEEITQRKIYGPHQGGAVLLTSMEMGDNVPLLEGEGLETTLSGAMLALRQTPILRLAATLSLNNHQGYVSTDQDGAIPLWRIEIDRKKKAFGFKNPGQVFSLIDADMKPHSVKVRRTRDGPVEIGLTPDERTIICQTLMPQKWRMWGARSHSNFTPPPTMDFNDYLETLHA